MSKPTWKQKLTHYTTIAHASAVAFAGWYVANPEVAALLPPKAALAITLSINALGFIGKFIPQGKSNEPS